MGEKDQEMITLKSAKNEEVQTEVKRYSYFRFSGDTVSKNRFFSFNQADDTGCEN